jgi:hypothetical protein
LQSRQYVRRKKESTDPLQKFGSLPALPMSRPKVKELIKLDTIISTHPKNNEASAGIAGGK